MERSMTTPEKLFVAFLRHEEEDTADAKQSLMGWKNLRSPRQIRTKVYDI
jgi:hypothetical protein